MTQDAQSVTQADREAAWPYHPSCYKVDDYTDWMAGKYDAAAPIIKGMQAHRLASQTTSAEDAVAYQRGIYDAKCWLRDQQHKNPPDSLWHAAAILADRMDVALLSSRPAPDTQTAAIGAEAIEAIAQFLHDEGGFAEAWSGRTWPEHPDDTGQRDGAFVKIVPSDVQAKFRDVATRLLHGFPALEEAARLRDALAYYANDEHYDGGDVPGHVYVLDDHGRTARAALSQPVAAPQAGPGAWVPAEQFIALRDELEALKATPPQPEGGTVEAMREALEWYRDQMCEGFCEGFTPRICKAAMEENPTGGDCAGCRAVLALQPEKTKP